MPDKMSKEPHPESMTGSQINKELDKLEKESSLINREFIDAGRGSERPSEWMKKTDELSVRSQKVESRLYTLRAEIKARYGPGAPSRLPTRHVRTIGRKSIVPKSLSACQVLKTHDDGDLTLQCKDAKYVVTTDGKTFKEVKK